MFGAECCHCFIARVNEWACIFAHVSGAGFFWRGFAHAREDGGRSEEAKKRVVRGRGCGLYWLIHGLSYCNELTAAIKQATYRKVHRRIQHLTKLQISFVL
jgi:hypothetical protein